MISWRIILRPLIVRPEEDLSLSAKVAGATIFINGAPLDLSPMQDGDVLPRGAVASPMIRGEIRRTGDVIEIPLTFPIVFDAPEAARFPAPILLTSDGPVPLPPKVMP